MVAPDGGVLRGSQDGAWPACPRRTRDATGRSGRAPLVPMVEPTDLRDGAPSPGGVTARGIGVSLSSDRCVRDRSWYEQSVGATRAPTSSLRSPIHRRPQHQLPQQEPSFQQAHSKYSFLGALVCPRPVLVCLPLHIDEVGVKRVCFFLRHPGVDPRPARRGAESWHALVLLLPPNTLALKRG